MVNFEFQVQVFLTRGFKKALEGGLQVEGGGFYRKEGLGVKAILGALGRTFLEVMDNNFDRSYVEEVYKKGRKDGKVLIGFDKISIER